MIKKIRSEDYEQMRFIKWFRDIYKDVRIFAIPNGGKRHISTAMTLKATGTMPGVPDLFIPAWKLWVEMKRMKGGNLSHEQKDFIEYLKSVGYECLVCLGHEDAKNQISEFSAKKGFLPTPIKTMEDLANSWTDGFPVGDLNC